MLIGVGNGGHTGEELTYLGIFLSLDICGQFRPQVMFYCWIEQLLCSVTVVFLPLLITAGFCFGLGLQE